MKTGELMSRAEFLTKTGIVLAAIPFISVIHGIKKGRFNYKVKKLSLSFDNLPPAFEGFNDAHRPSAVRSWLASNERKDLRTSPRGLFDVVVSSKVGSMRYCRYAAQIAAHRDADCDRSRLSGHASGRVG